MTTKRLSLIVLFVLLISTACNTGQPDESSVTETAVPISEEPTQDVWIYVGLGDSFTGYATWPVSYRLFLQEELGVTIEYRNWTIGAGTITDQIEQIQTSDKLRSEIMQAKLITVNCGHDGFRTPTYNYRDGNCGGTDGQDCLRAAYYQAEADWEAYLDELIDLRSPEEAAIVTFQGGMGLTETVCEWGSECYETVTSYTKKWADFIEQTAVERGIYVVNTNRLVNGEDYDQPANQELFKDDKVHWNSEGSVKIVELLIQLDLHKKPPLESDQQ